MSRMGDVHRLILQHGLEGARSFAATKAERGVIEAAASLLSEEESCLGITHAGFAMTSLPHKRIEEGVWRRDGHRTTLLVESGRSRTGTLVGVPYGSIARLILLYLQTEAVRTNTPEVELGRSMKSWMGRMSLSRTSRNQEGTASPSAVRATLDDPPIRIRPILPASAGAKDKNPVGSGHYGTPSFAPRVLNRKGFFAQKLSRVSR